MQIYLDNAATTKPLPDALSIHADFGWYNPSAAYGLAEEVFKRAAQTRSLLMQTVRLGEGGCIFTSGGTEANNIALLSAFKSGAHYVTSTIEHPSVYAVFRYIEQQGGRVSYVKPKGFCILADDVASEVREDTALVSIMHVNNETGALNDIAAICAAVKAKNQNTLFHSDGVQALFKTPVDLTHIGADTYSVSAHKIHGLKGLGALLYRANTKLKPLLYGGGQENTLRSGTENTLGIQAFDTALRQEPMDIVHAQTLHNELMDGLLGISGTHIHLPGKKVPHILSVSFEGMRAEVLVRLLGSQGIYIGSGAACARGKISRVLLECGVPRALAEGAVRFSFSRHNTKEEIKICTEAVQKTVSQLRMS